MTLQEARQILRLGPDEDPRLHMREFEIVRKKLAEMVRDAADDQTAGRLQLSLNDMDCALGVLRKHMAETPPAPVLPPTAAEIQPAPAGAPTDAAKADAGPPPAETPPALREAPARHSGFRIFFLAAASLAAVAVAAWGWLYLNELANQRYERQTRIAELEGKGAEHIRQRHWAEAQEVFGEIQRLDPGSEIAAAGLRDIGEGMAEEREMFVNYWSGQARAALESARFDEAREAAGKVLAEVPDHAECLALAEEIAAARLSANRLAAIETAKNHIGRREWEPAVGLLRELLEKNPDDPETAVLLEDTEAAREKASADHATARVLFQKAKDKDTGEYDEELFGWMREAAGLAPSDAEITAFFTEVSARSRSLRVPEDFPDPAQALAHVRENDRILLGEGEWEGPLEALVPVEIIGAGEGKTIISCPGEAGNVIAFGPDASGSRVSRVSFRHATLTGGDSRFAVALVRAGAVAWEDCEFLDGCGHGLALIDGAQSTVNRCRFIGNGWDGAAASGAETRLDIRNSTLAGNFNHGLEAWDGAALTAVDNRCESNTGNGVHIDSSEAPAVLLGNQLNANREFGMVITSAGATGQIRRNSAARNQLGGMAIRAMTLCPVTHNKLERNSGPGLALEDGLNPIAYRENTSSGNSGKDLLTGMKYNVPEEPGNEEDTAAR